MNKQLRIGVSILVPILLLALLSQVSLAQPEETHTWENRLVGFYLVRETMNSGPTSIGDPNAGWEEKGSSSVNANGLTFSIPDMILKAKTDEQGELYFPNLEGRRFFLAKEYFRSDDPQEYAYRLYSDLAAEENNMQVSDLGTTHTVSGTLYYTAPLNDPTWTEDNQIWAAYQVWQQPDGTVYLEDGGNSYGGTVDCSMTKTITYKETHNGETTSENTLGLTVNFRYISRLEHITVEQFTADNQPVISKTITAQEVLNGQSEVSISLENNTAYTLICEHYADSTVHRTLLEREGEPVSHTC